ncbi:MAG: YebC/PmpR family DNA-binding transcriptional regulator [Oscillospiraceae bacterium]|nr:YebC/PmpR family DNA-binding transcriptional regulator [Oscillospiraceae bacterium]MBR6209375.1 YebC/PmpR family DNA-binding transcriptional regulator [Oscillospiraceae bacterium]
MSGHSKWHNIQKTKGAADAKRAQAFTKIAREMIVAVKEGGGGDPRSNSKLAAVIAKAKAANMPNDNIKRTIDKALGSGSTDNYERVTYEGYGPSGVAVIVDAMTDNRKRTASDVRHYFDKYGGNLGPANCVSWSFDRKGVIVIDNEDGDLDEESVLEAVLEAGGDDMEMEDEIITAYTAPDDVAAVSEALSEKYHLLSAQVEMVPQSYISLTSEGDIKNMEKMLEMFEDNDDVQNVWHNWDNGEA